MFPASCPPSGSRTVRVASCVPRRHRGGTRFRTRLVAVEAGSNGAVASRICSARPMAAPSDYTHRFVMPATPLRAGSAVDSAALDDAIRRAISYRVLGPEGDLGAVIGVPEAGRPPRPLVLVVRCGKTVQ